MNMSARIVCATLLQAVEFRKRYGLQQNFDQEREKKYGGDNSEKE